jgi:hypothetical protein
MRNLCCCSSI